MEMAMESRETSAMAPTASGNVMNLLAELQAAFSAGGNYEAQERREARMYELMRARKDEITLTLLHMIGEGSPLAYIMNNALLGLRYNKDREQPIPGIAMPLHDVIELQSLRKSCPKCPKDECGRKGKAHDIVYKTATKSGTGAEHRMIVAMGGHVQDYVRCKVDPETGRFFLPPLEAKKALREWGENAIRATRRWVDRAAKKGDRWLIREVRHYDLYANSALINATPDGVEPMAAG